MLMPALGRALSPFLFQTIEFQNSAVLDGQCFLASAEVVLMPGRGELEPAVFAPNEARD